MGEGAIRPIFEGGSKLIGKYRFFVPSLRGNLLEVRDIYVVDNVTLFLKMNVATLSIQRKTSS